MVLMSRRHAEVLEELGEWREDVRERGIGSRVVLLAVPRGWGRSAVLTRFAEQAGAVEGPVTLVTRIGGSLPGDRAVQALALREALARVAPPSRWAEWLDVDTAAGRAGLGVDVAGMVVPGLGVAAPVLSRLLGAAGRARDDGPAGEAGAVARAARAVAAVSVKVPVVVVIDDADLLDPGVARVMIGGLAGRYDGRVLVVAAASPGSVLAQGLGGDPGPDLAERIRKVDADPGMGYPDRVELARELLPGLPDEAVERVARRTVTFGEVFTVAAADLLAGPADGPGAGDRVAAVDAVADALLERAVPSPEAAVLAWAGGALQERQVEACLQVLGAERASGDVHVRRVGLLACLGDPASPRCAEQAAAFSPRQRTMLAGAVLAAAGEAARGGEGLADRVVARLAVHRVRAALDPALQDQVPAVQCALVRGLELLGDLDAAWRVTGEALAEAPEDSAGRRDLLTARLRLAQVRAAGGHPDPLAREAVVTALATGAVIRLEARVWAACDLLGRDGDRERALALAGQVAGELAARQDLGEAGDQWRLLLGFAAGRAGALSLTQQLLASLLTSGAASREKPAEAVLRAVDGPHADIRLEIIVLQAELDATPDAAQEDRLRLQAALAAACSSLGLYREALGHGQQELAYRQRLQHPGHPRILHTRNDIVFWTGRAGDAAEALRQAIVLLPDMERVLGQDHPGTLATRHHIAALTGECGDAAGALGLFTALLPDQERVLGPGDPDTLTTRSNIAVWTGDCGDAAGALRLSTALLPDRERALGPGHPDTLTSRHNIAAMTGQCGDAAGALRLSTALLPDQERILGPGHPQTLATRNNIAAWTGQCGDAAGALRLSTALLPDQERILGPGHPDALTTRHNIAFWTGECGDAAGALRLFTALLLDQERVLGPGHPDTLTTRSDIAFWTSRCGDAAGVLWLFTALLPDQEQILGPGHSDTLATRNDIAFLTASSGHEAGDDPDQLMPDELRTLIQDAMAAGNTAAAVSYCEQMVAAAVQAWGSSDIRLTVHLRQAAGILAAAGRDTEAIQKLTIVVSINDRYGSETPEAVSDLRTLAGLQQRNGLHNEARQNLDHARDIEAHHHSTASQDL
jgi:Tetratricopeptide repeat